jgi:hypothetical protein
MEIKFNHAKSTVSDAIGVEKFTANQITGKIMFEIINQQFMVQELYDNPYDAPDELRKKSVVLENVIKDCANQAEVMLAAWEYSRIDSMMTLDNGQADNILKMITMFYAMSDKKRDAFVKLFVERACADRDDD